MLAINRFGFGALAAAGAFSLAIPWSAGAVTLDELKGYSIGVTATAYQVWKQIQDRNDTISNDIHVVRKIYVSLAGRIFDYGDLAVGERWSDHQRAVVAPDSAASTTRQEMVAWTIEGGNLVSITHEIEGFVVRTISVDLAHMTCSITVVLHPDPATGRVVIMKLNGYKSELASMTLRSADCVIRRGNIFATDQ